MKSVVKCFVIFFAALLCMGIKQLNAMETAPGKRDQFAATKAVLRMLYNDTQESFGNKWDALKEKFPHITRKQFAAGLVAICLAIGVEEFIRTCFMSNSDWFLFLSMTNVQDIFFGAVNHT